MATKQETTETQEVKNRDKVVLGGIVKSAFTKTKTTESGETITTNIITLYDSDLTLDGSSNVWGFFETFYSGKPAKWVPEWFKNKSGVTLKSGYDGPVVIVDTGEKMMFESFVNRGLIRDAKVEILCNVKDSAIYPRAMKVVVEGSEYNPFEEW